MSRIDDPMNPTSPGGEQIREKAQQVGQNLRDMAQIASDAAKAKYEQARQSAGEYYEQGKERLSETQEKIETYIREKPWQALAIAAGTGVLLGLLLRRRR